MRIVLPIYEERIAPVFDVARRFMLVNVDIGEIVQREWFSIQSADPYEKVARLIELKTNVLICGAISWPLEAILVSSDTRVIPNTCGSCNAVLAAFCKGGLTERAFLMPGCTGRRYRRRGRHGRGRRNI